MNTSVAPLECNLANTASFAQDAGLDGWGIQHGLDIVRAYHQVPRAKARTGWRSPAGCPIETLVQCAGHGSAQAAPAINEFLNPCHGMGLTRALSLRESIRAAANSAAGIGVPNRRRTSAVHEWRFFVPASWRAVCGSRKARLSFGRYANRAPSATLIGVEAADSINRRSPTMLDLDAQAQAPAQLHRNVASIRQLLAKAKPVSAPALDARQRELLASILQQHQQALAELHRAVLGGESC